MKNTKSQFKVSATFIGENSPTYGTKMKIDTPEQCIKFWEDYAELMETFDPEKEHLIVIALDTKFQLKGFNVVSVGTLNETIAHPREIFRPLVTISAHSFILMHNHPSGDPKPSDADRQLTNRIKDGAEIMRIRFIDHVIVGKPQNHSQGYFSFREMGLI